jgi:hypothetical protein
VLPILKGERAMLYGTDQGELYKVDVDATTDDGQLINMRWRTGWIGSQQWMKLKRIWIDFILARSDPEAGMRFTVTSNNKYIDSHEIANGGSEKIATMDEGSYSGNELATEIQTKMRAAQAADYNWLVSYSSVTKKFTISNEKDWPFELHWNSGTHGSTNLDDHIGTLIGFDDDADDNGSNTFTSDNEVPPLPGEKNLIFKVYSNFRDTAELNINLEGSTPTGANPELRNVIHQKIDMAIKGSFFSFEFINTEDIEGLLQVIKFWLYIKTTPGRRTISAE